MFVCNSAIFILGGFQNDALKDIPLLYIFWLHGFIIYFMIFENSGLLNESSIKPLQYKFQYRKGEKRIKDALNSQYL